MTTECDELLDLYQRCVNRIDDYLEYAWHAAQDKRDVRDTVMSYIDDLTEAIKETRKRGN